MSRPYFIWDYDISEDELRQMLRSDNEVERIWAISRIVQYARFADIWKYLAVEDIVKSFDKIWFRQPYFKELWAYALGVWGYPPDGDNAPGG
jgi:hypothetical protein